MEKSFSDALEECILNDTTANAIKLSLKKYVESVKEDSSLKNLKTTIQRINNCWNLVLRKNPTLVHPKDFFKDVVKEYHLNDTHIMGIFKNYPDYINYFKSL